MFLFKINCTDKRDYKNFIELAERTNVFKACGNVDNMWIWLKFTDAMHFYEWQEEWLGCHIWDLWELEGTV